MPTSSTRIGKRPTTTSRSEAALAVLPIGVLRKALISRAFLRAGAAARQLSRISHRVFTRVLGPGGVVRLTLGRLFWSPGRPLPRGDAVYFTYIRRELRRRLKQSLVIALGLALGIALVITVSSASAGVKNAQRQVLHSLYGVGTDMTVTRTATRRIVLMRSPSACRGQLRPFRRASSGGTAARCPAPVGARRA